VSAGTHEKALFDRVMSSSEAVDLPLANYCPPDGYRLVMYPLQQVSIESFGVALLATRDREVAYLSQISCLWCPSVMARPMAHILSKRLSMRHAEALRPKENRESLDMALAVGYLAPRFDLIYTREGYGWHRYLTKMSSLSTRGLVLYRLTDGRLEMLDRDDAIEQNEDFTELMRRDPAGLCLASGNAQLDGTPQSPDMSQIHRLDIAWLEHL
jgi:hypothetical protein